MKKIKAKSLTVKALVAILISFIISSIFMILGNNFIKKLLMNRSKYSPIDFVQKYNFITLGIIIIPILAFIITFITLIRKRISYLKYIIDSVSEIEKEQFLSKLNIVGNDEFAELATSINTMSQRLEEKFNKEKEIEDSKYELITSVSHDLKTPLTSIVGYLEVLNNKKVDEDVKDEYIKIAYNKSLRLKVLINELFEYTRLTSNDIKIEKVRFNISNLINQIVGESILSFSERGIEVNLENPYKELYCDINVRLISRVFENLVKNAEKYSDNNSIFRVIVEENEQNITMHFINKCGKITQNDLGKIFEKFYRVDEARSSENEGSGLGLTIAKRIIELHDGEIIVEKNKENIKFKIIINKT
ncbi:MULTISPECIES: HAMP domain-containing sensor histidine kinase [unclassified Clostridium]|uniref:sensor histidine kinase n=1 Tax=unclassified Clostridium TaxID=2614128 RepID=UPI003218007C